MHTAQNHGGMVHISISCLSSAYPCNIYTLLTQVFWGSLKLFVKHFVHEKPLFKWHIFIINSNNAGPAADKHNYLFEDHKCFPPIRTKKLFKL